MREEMQRDENVYCIGEDIGTYGGAFRATAGFLEEFGRPRILDTPLSEIAIIGASVGSALHRACVRSRRCSSPTSSPTGSTCS